MQHCPQKLLEGACNGNEKYVLIDKNRKKPKKHTQIMSVGNAT